MLGFRLRSFAALRTLLAAALVLAAPAASLPLDAQGSGTRTQRLPASIPDAEFWRLVTEFSEAGGQFPSDNFTSNESNFPDIVASLQSQGLRGGAYIGVGPEQNFQYIAAIRPQIVFQLDIRRQAIMQHLMYKAIFELSRDRADFISLLFSKPRPPGLDSSSTIAEIWSAYWYVSTDTSVYQRNLTRIKDQLTRTHRFDVGADDMALLTYVYEAFYYIGPQISYSGYGAPQNGLPAPAGANFGGLTNAVDASGTPRSFLATEENYRFIKDLHSKNLIIPVVADFAGQKGIAAVANWLRQRDTKVTAFYVSNVESYLFRNGVASNFYANVGLLPTDSASVFIRPSGGRSSSGGAVRYMIVVNGVVQSPAAGATTPPPSASMAVGSSLCPIQPFLAAFAERRVNTFSDASACRR